jgi:protein gp37
MGEQTAISWTDHSFNPWWGCCKVSPGCEHCYALAFAKRVGHDIWGPAQTTPRRLFGGKHWAEPFKWDVEAQRARRRARVFCASMADVFEDHPMLPLEREKLWGTIGATPFLDWQLLTKRPENIRDMVPPEWLDQWPRNAWIGTTVEDQQRAEERIPPLLTVPAAVRLLSCEPLLGPVDLTPWLVPPYPDYSQRDQGGLYRAARFPEYGGGWSVIDYVEAIGPATVERWTSPISWVIIGGESGPKYRPMDLAWARRLVDDCAAAAVAVWFKQAGGLYPGRGADALGQLYHEFPLPAEVGCA